MYLTDIITNGIADTSNRIYKITLLFPNDITVTYRISQDLNSIYCAICSYKSAAISTLQVAKLMEDIEYHLNKHLACHIVIKTIDGKKQHVSWQPGTKI